MPSLAFTTNLNRLLWLRVVMMTALALASLVATRLYHITLPATEVTIALGMMLTINIASWLRLRHKARIHETELFAQLLLDVAILSGLFFLTGGYSNPFVWMYLLPLAVAAVALSSRYTWLIATLVIAAYSALMFWYQPLVMADHAHLHSATTSHALHDDSFNLHLLGMWGGFVVSAIVIAFFVERMGRNLREYDRLLAESREKLLASERMLALGTLATGAAHELGTPLSTMAVLTKDLLQENQHQHELVASLTLLRKQVDRCKEILSSLTAAAGMMRSEDSRPMTIESFIRQLAQRWSDTRPATLLTLELNLPQPCPTMVADLALGQAITNLINNAADASPDRISLIAEIQQNILLLDIHDYGDFPDASTLANMGEPFNTSKQATGGLGLGIFLAKSVLEKFDGDLAFERLQPEGTQTRISIPLASILIKDMA